MCCGKGFPAWIIIIVTAALIPMTCVITYFWARALDHVEWTFPYISDSGRLNPEGCVFALMLALAAIGTFLCVCVRWTIVCEHYEASRCIAGTNHTSLAFGMIGSLGILIVATFREDCIDYAHFIGAFLAFGLGCVYMILQGIISICEPTRTIPGRTKCLGYFRLLIGVLATASAITSGGLGVYLNLTRTVPLQDEKWDSSIEGYDLHLVSTSCEWAAAGLVALYFLTFLAEFKEILIGMPTIHFDIRNKIGPATSSASSSSTTLSSSSASFSSPPPHHPQHAPESTRWRQWQAS